MVSSLASYIRVQSVPLPSSRSAIAHSVSPEFVINGTEGQSEADIMAIIKKNMKSMADELGGEIAERLERVFENMPTVREA